MPIETVGRHLSFSAAFNVRDLGGLQTRDGLEIRRRLVYRADGLHRLPAEDIDRLAAMGLRTVVDLRTATELDNAPSFRADGIEVLHLPILEEIWDHSTLDDSTDPVDFLVARYLEMLDSGASAIKTVFELLADERRRPLAFHCSAGKDRTGVVAALVLATLGIPDDVIADDYETSADAMGKLVEWVRANRPEAADAMNRQPAAFLSCPAEAMLGFLDRLRAGWGSVESYLRSIEVPPTVLANVQTALVGAPIP